MRVGKFITLDQISPKLEFVIPHSQKLGNTIQVMINIILANLFYTTSRIERSQAFDRSWNVFEKATDKSQHHLAKQSLGVGSNKSHMR